MINIANLANSSQAPVMKLAQFARGKLEHNVPALFAHSLGSITCAAPELPAFARFKLNVMYQGPSGNGLKRQSVARFYVNVVTRLYHVAQFDAQGGEYVPLFAIDVIDQGNARRPIRIILNRGHLARDGSLIPSEIDDSKLAFTAATSVTHSYNAPVIASCLLLESDQ